MHQMPDSGARFYRAYYLNRSGGIQRAEVIQARDDDDAILKIQETAEGRTVEIWDRARFVGKVESATSATVGKRPEPAVEMVHATGDIV